jgi:hypothetical protein
LLVGDSCTLGGRCQQSNTTRGIFLLFRTSNTWHFIALLPKTSTTWCSRNGSLVPQSPGLNHPKFEEAFFNEGTSTFEVLRRTLNYIAIYHIWRYRCNILYRGEITPTVVTANNIRVEFTQTLRARLSYIKAKANWWTYRVEVVPKAIADQNLGKIEVEQSVLLALFPDWKCPRLGTLVSLEMLNNLSPYKDNVYRRGQGYSLPPTFPTFDPNWKI